MKKRKITTQVPEVINPGIKGTPALLISQAIAKGADLEKLEKLLTLQERYEDNQAKKAYYQSLSDFKAENVEILKDFLVNYETKTGGRIKYKYATLPNIMKKLNPVLSKYGLSISWKPTGQDMKEKTLTISCIVTHKLGYSEEFSLTGPFDESGSKNPIQSIGSAGAYLARYTVGMAFGLAPAGMDDDGRTSGAPIEFIDDTQLSKLLDIIDNNKVNKPKFLSYLKVEKFEQLPKADFQKAMIALQNIIKGGKP